MTIANPAPYYRVSVQVGDYPAWVVTRDPAAPPPPDYGPTDSLRVSWELPEDGTAYPDPNVIVCAFGLVVADAAELADLAIGDRVIVRVWAWPPGTVNPYDGVSVYPPVVTFRGKLAQSPSARPHKLGMIYALTATGYVAVLAERDNIGVTDWPAESDIARLNRISSELGQSAIAIYTTTAQLAARPASPDNALNLLLQTTAECVMGQDFTAAGGDQYFRQHIVPFYLDPVNDDDPVAGSEFGTVFGSTRLYQGDLATAYPVFMPGVFALRADSGLWGIEIEESATRHERIFSADLTDFDSSWALLKGHGTDQVTVKGPFSDGSVAVQVSGPAPVPTRLSLDTDLTSVQSAAWLGALNVMDSDTDRWVADKFMFRADLDPHTLLYPRAMFNDAELPALQYAPAVLAGIDPTKNPAGGIEWYAGQLAGAAFILEGGRYRVELKLKRNLPRAYIQTTTSALNRGYLNPAQLKAALPYSAVRVDQLDPRFSVFDYRIVRNPNA